MSYLSKDELDKYLKGLPRNNKSQGDAESPPPSRAVTGGNLKGPRPAMKPASWRTSAASSSNNTLHDARNDLIYPMQKQLRLNNYQDDESIRPQVDRLQQATGTAAAAAALEESHTRPPAPPKPRGGAVDAFEASLAPRRRQATPVTNNPTPTTPVSPPPPPVATKPVDFATKPVSPSATATPALNGRPAQQPPPIPSKPPSSSSPSSRSHPPPIPVKKPSPPLPPPSLKADDNDRVSVANPLYTGVRCAGCNKPIAGRVIRVDQNQWHVDCFKCKHCKQDLEHIAFHSKDGQPYCALDYHELFSTRCDYCGTPIEEKSISALGKTYHVGHFFCRECGKPFDESSAFMVHEGHPYCEKDYLAKFGHKCMGCGEYITGEFLGALGGDWHKECFVCADCGKAFESATFYVRNNKPFCEEHYKNPRSGNVKICQQCGDVIDGRAASAFGKDYHPHHFQCARCSKILSSRVPGMWMEGAPGELICKMCGRR